MNANAESKEYFVEAGEEHPLVFRRPLEDAEMDITPMIDITFLLLIFFLVASRLDEDAPVELPKARYGIAVAEKSSIPITIAQGSGDTANVYLADGRAADKQVNSTDLIVQEQEIVRYIEENLANGKEHVLVKAEKGVRHRDVARVSDAVGKAGSGDLYVAVMEVQ
jgi:biopolymer transport protein ExbD